LVRPSFVLSGAAMSVASNAEELVSCLQSAEEVSPDKPVVISKYIVNAKEIEFDGVAQDGHVLNYAISEHVENAGVHSGDATLLLPAQKLYVHTSKVVKHIASHIAAALKISGPFNIQFLAKDNTVKVIECNLRASRTFPFISKTLDANFITLATKVMMGYPCKPFNISLYGKAKFVGSCNLFHLSFVLFF
jgi:carbamoyl-phosphate synthase